MDDADADFYIAIPNQAISNNKTPEMLTIFKPVKNEVIIKREQMDRLFVFVLKTCFNLVML